MEAKLHNVSQLRHLPPKVEQLIASHDSREGCWVWHGKTSRWGYGAVRVYYVDGTDGYSGCVRVVLDAPGTGQVQRHRVSCPKRPGVGS